MLFQLEGMQEIQVLLYVTAIVLGIQLGFYIVYQYYKTRELNHHIHRILLSLASFLLLIIPGILILTINQYFITDLIMRDIFFKITFALIVTAQISFIYFINIENFLKVNKNVTKIFMVFSIILIFIVFFVPELSTLLSLFLLITIVPSAIYIGYYHVKLIRTSYGKIKTYLVLSLLGEYVIFTSLFLNTLDQMSFSSVTALLIGIIIIFIAISSFPEFLEFEWTEALSSLYIINTSNNECIYNYEFYKKFKESRVNLDGNQEESVEVLERAPDPQLRECINCGYRLKEGWTECPNCASIQIDIKEVFSGGLVGIERIISAITNTQDEKINKIKQGDSFILLEHGSGYTEHISYVLLVRKEQKFFRIFLNTLKSQFESFYKDILSNIDDIKGNKDMLFLSFNVIIENIVQER